MDDKNETQLPNQNSTPELTSLPDAGNTHVAAAAPLWKRIFMGPHEMRAGWRLLIYLLMAALLMAGLGWVLTAELRHANHGPAVAPIRLWLSECLAFLVVVLSSLIMGRYEKRTLGDYGVPAKGAFGARFWEGIGWGFGSLTALLLILRVTGHFYFGSVVLSPRAILWFGATWAIAFLFVAFFEEFLLRGYAQFTLTTGMGFWPAAILLSVAFAGLHIPNPGENWVGILNVVVIGIFFCITLRRTGNLWFAVGFHAAWDWAESFFYGVPDSGALTPGHLFQPSFAGSRYITGGTAGPEGSLIATVVILGITFLLVNRFPTALYPRPDALVPRRLAEPEQTLGLLDQD